MGTAAWPSTGGPAQHPGSHSFSCRVSLTGFGARKILCLIIVTVATSQVQRLRHKVGMGVVSVSGQMTNTVESYSLSGIFNVHARYLGKGHMCFIWHLEMRLSFVNHFLGLPFLWRDYGEKEMTAVEYVECIVCVQSKSMVIGVFYLVTFFLVPVCH